MTLDEAIWKEMSLAFDYKERMRMMQMTGEALGDLPKLKAEHKQMSDWLKELKTLRDKGEAEMSDEYKPYKFEKSLLSSLPLPKSAINALANTEFWLTAENWEKLRASVESLPTILNEVEKEEQR